MFRASQIQANCFVVLVLASIICAIAYLFQVLACSVTFSLIALCVVDHRNVSSRCFDFEEFSAIVITYIIIRPSIELVQTRVSRQIDYCGNSTSPLSIPQ